MPPLTGRQRAKFGIWAYWRPDSWLREWFNRIKDLVNQHQPDLLHSDGRLPFESDGLSQVANLYSLSAQKDVVRVATRSPQPSRRPGRRR